jgi:hypothetical protein
MKEKCATTLRLVLLCLVLLLVFSGCNRPKTTDTEPTIPASYTTFTDEMKLFSIAYPSEWKICYFPQLELEATIIAEVQANTGSGDIKEYGLFTAGVSEGAFPMVSVSIRAIPSSASSHSQVVDAVINPTRQNENRVQELSRLETTVEGREATILELEVPEFYMLHMITTVDRRVWEVACSSDPEDSEQWKDDFQVIVRSLRLLK